MPLFSSPLASRKPLALLAACALATLTSLAFAPAAHAQTLIFTLSDVAFQDGATANGFFEFNPTTNAFGNFDIATTAGITPINGMIVPQGFNFTPATTDFLVGSDDSFLFFTSSRNFLNLSTVSAATAPGTYAFVPGASVSTDVFTNSGEFTNDNSRGIIAGNLIVRDAAIAPIPEPSEYAAMGMAGFALCGLMVRARRKSGNSAKKAPATA